MARKKLGEMLVEAGVLSEQALRMALNEQRRWGGTLGRTLIEMKAISEAELVRVLSLQLNMPTVDLDHLEIHPTVLELVSADFAEQHSIVPFAQPMKFLDVAMAEPTNVGVLDELRIRTQLNIRPYLVGPKMLERAIGTHYRRGFARLNARRDVEIAIDVGEPVSPGLGGPQHARPGTAEIDAARKREGLRPAPRPTRPLPLDGPPAGNPTSASSGPTSSGPPPIESRDPEVTEREINALQDRITKLEALVERDEEVLRKLLALLVEKGVATRDEILERIR